jgi:hypothetical protein
MTTKIILITLGTWFLFMVLAIINAGIRNNVYKTFVGDLAAHQISTIIFIILILAVTYLSLKKSNIKISDYYAVLIGTTWLLLTILFEFIAGHYVFGNSWEKLIADYNILKGRIWSLVLITLLLSPYISKRLLSIR